MDSKQKVTENHITWAYQVLESIIEAYNMVAATKTVQDKIKLMQKLNQEYVEHIGQICEAFTILTSQEHRPMVIKYFKAYAGVFESWRNKKIK